jgi:hypothetical protein
MYQWLLVHGSTTERDDLQLIQRVENKILPLNLVSSLLKQALASVFVLGSSNDDDESLHETKTFCEAVATLHTRRAPRSEIHSLFAKSISISNR